MANGLKRIRVSPPEPPITHYDPLRKRPEIAPSPRQVVVLMRHGDRSPIPMKIGKLDVSHQAKAWQALLPGPEDSTRIDSIPIRRSHPPGPNSYARFAGEGPWGQLTGRGVAQCRAVGEELRRRYPRAEIRAFSTDFPRTKQSAASVLIGFDALGVPVTVRSPEEETLLPNFDGACSRFAQLHKTRKAEAREGKLRDISAELQKLLEPAIGEKPLDGPILDFKPFCVHAESVGKTQGIDWEVTNLTEHYLASLEAAVYEDAELVRLASGRLVKEVTDALIQSGHRITLLLAHDNMLTAFLIAIGVFKQQWPIYASTVVLETADFDGELRVRVLMNDEVCMDWVAWGCVEKTLRVHSMTPNEYAEACVQP
eukprot:TRINITY_DN108500_c0_g1_i1.p1 TRINITY_DN108500_c0_g1~~TRINITY_DN108500_c0_g1_i1.p1  ORF type:complete len:382 (+),score=49.33 TRINITY_DN108500_c0_g1_i1:42-1148(+)